MAVYSGPEIVNNKLVLHLDAASSASRLGPNIITDLSLNQFYANQNVTVSQQGNSIVATSNQNTSSPGVWPIGNNGNWITVNSNTQYTFRALASIVSGSTAYLYVSGNFNGNLVWQGSALTDNHQWIENTFNTGSNTALKVGILWSGPTVGSTVKIESVGLYKTNNWYNIAGAGYVTNGTYLPQYTDLNGVKCFNFNQTDSYFENASFFTNPFPTDRTNLTIDAWYCPAAAELTSGDRGNIIKAVNGNAFYMSWNKGTQQQSNYWYGKASEGYHESGAAMTRGKWYNIVAVWNSSSLSQYLNGVKTTATTTGTTANQTYGVSIGWEGSSRQLSGYLANIKLYDSALTESQIKQNFEATRTRYGV